MSDSSNKKMLDEEEALKEKLEYLKCQIDELHSDLPYLKQCSRLSHLLQKVYEIHEGLNRLEQGLLHTHLRCCISPTTIIPGEVVCAVSNLSAKHHGAIIVVEQEDNLVEFLQGGVDIEAAVNASVLENIFFPGSPLHDGAVIIKNSRILKAGTFLPLAPHAPGLGAIGLGTRHRAALGISQVSDALVIVVSEEKGWISMALKGQFYPNLGTYALLERLGEHDAETSMEERH
ncbi:MAG: DNA integrity scanning protein DisA nucleotide-binding domain protein [Deltaproteobacteria bacterium]|nr:DNA integrity scanning protein DisA nucleotide-binding domain protein [Deltaproteobacteria bacterium]